MSKIARSLIDLIGNTPLLELSNYNKITGITAHHETFFYQSTPRELCDYESEYP